MVRERCGLPAHAVCDADAERGWMCDGLRGAVVRYHV